MKRKLSVLFVFGLLLVFCTLASAAAPDSPVLTKTVDGFDVTMSWPEIDGATGYTLCYATYPEGTPIDCLDLGNENSISLTLWEGASYYVACKAYSESDGETESSGYSNIGIISVESASADLGAEAVEHMVYLSDSIGIRVAGSQEEIATRDYIVSTLLNLGLPVSIQKFEFESDEAFKESYNVSVVLSGTSPKQVIVGAHYDSVDVGEGTSDNASGVGALLAMVEALMHRELPYTVKFVAFGAEEVGLKGSRHYASKMSALDIVDTIAMINLDTLVGGDKIYVYGGADDAGWIRDQALGIAETMEIPFETNPGFNEDYPAGTTGDWSDHAPFKALGIPYAYFESTNWEIGDLDGYAQTEKFGEIWHTENDTLSFFNTEYPGRVEEQMSAMMNILNALLLSIDPPETESPVLRKKRPAINYFSRSGNPL